MMTQKEILSYPSNQKESKKFRVPNSKSWDLCLLQKMSAGGHPKKMLFSDNLKSFLLWMLENLTKLEGVFIQEKQSAN